MMAEAVTEADGTQRFGRAVSPFARAAQAGGDAQRTITAGRGRSSRSRSSVRRRRPHARAARHRPSARSERIDSVPHGDVTIYFRANAVASRARLDVRDSTRLARRTGFA